MVRTHWWLRSYSSQALEGYKLKVECLFLICLVLLLALNCNFWHKTYLNIFHFEYNRLQHACTVYDRRTETEEERKRTTTTKWYTSNSSNLVEEITPQILSLDTKPFVISVDELFQVGAYFLCSRKKFEFLFSTGIYQSSVSLLNLFSGLFGFNASEQGFFYSVCLTVFRFASTVTRKSCPHVMNI